MTTPAVLHADRPVRLAVRGDETIAVKRYLAGGAVAIHGQMAALWASPFGESRWSPGMPRPLGVNPVSEEVEMQFLAGDPIGTKGGPGRSAQLLPEVARLLADLHGSGVQVARRRDPAALLRSSRRKAGELSAGPVGELAHRVVDALAAALPPVADLVLSHGDFSPRNVLLTPAGLVLIDFDRLQMAAPERDIAYWGAWTWVTLLVSGQHPSWQVAAELGRAYRRSRLTLAESGSSSWAFHQAIALLRIAHGWSALQTAPDIASTVLNEALRILDR